MKGQATIVRAAQTTLGTLHDRTGNYEADSLLDSVLGDLDDLIAILNEGGRPKGDNLEKGRRVG